MPQMMPLNWLMLMMYFLMIFLSFNILIYFSSIKKFDSNKIDYKIQINWKW